MCKSVFISGIVVGVCGFMRNRADNLISAGKRCTRSHGSLLTANASWHAYEQFTALICTNTALRRQGLICAQMSCLDVLFGVN